MLHHVYYDYTGNDYLFRPHPCSARPSCACSVSFRPSCACSLLSVANGTVSSPELSPGEGEGEKRYASYKVVSESALLARMNGREPVHHDNVRARAPSERRVQHKAGRRYYAQLLSSHAARTFYRTILRSSSRLVLNC